MRGVPVRRHVGRPRGGDPVETRRVLLDAAEECFAKAGFAGATTRQMAARAGVNVATLHYHFGSKEELFQAVSGGQSGDAPPDDDDLHEVGIGERGALAPC